MDKRRIIFSEPSLLSFKLRKKYFEQHLRQRKKTTPGRNLRFHNTPSRIEKILKSPLFGAIFDVPFSLLFLIAIFFIHPLMGMFSLMGVDYGFNNRVLLIEKKLHQMLQEAMKTYGESRAYLTSYFQNPSSYLYGKSSSSF